MPDITPSIHGARKSRQSLPTVLSQTTLCELDLKHGADFDSSVDSIFPDGHVRRTSRANSEHSTCTGTSTKDSGFRYAEPAQTLIFLDWDDTLCPTSYLAKLQIMQADKDGRLLTSTHVAGDVAAELAKWGDAVYQFLCLAKSTGLRVAVITNSKRPWVETCIGHLAPRLRQLFESVGSTLHVVYADEVLMLDTVPENLVENWSCCFSGCGAILRSALASCAEEDDESQSLHKRCTRAKHVAMKCEAERFYSRYPGQTWKNIICMGDMKFEHDAVRQLAKSRAHDSPQRERLRIKTILTPRGISCPSIVELTLHLKLSCCLLRAYASFDGDFHLDLSRADAIADIATSLHMPQLKSVSLPRAAFGWAEEALDEEATLEALDQVDIAVQDWMNQDDTSRLTHIQAPDHRKGLHLTA